MTFPDAVRVLMIAAQRDVRGSGMGYRENSDKWREEVCAAWIVAFMRLRKRPPTDTELFNAGIQRSANAPGQARVPASPAPGCSAGDQR